jgi:predicted ester cyclase
MNSREIVQALLDSIQKGDFENAQSFLTSDFHFSGPMPEPFTAEQWIGMSAGMKAAFPDLDYHFVVQNADRDVVNTTHQLSGTHTGSFDLTLWA